MTDKKLAFPFVVEPFQEDYTGRLSWSTLGNHILRVSSLHAEAHGFGYTYMKKHNRGWVLARLVFDIDELPQTAEPYFLSTWVSRIFGQFTDRLYSLTAPDGTTYGYGYSTWALIDYETRQPVNLEMLPDDGFHAALLDEKVPISPPTRVRVKDDKLVLKHTAVYSDLDINGHVNSIRYIDMALDSFPKSWHDERRVTRVELNFGNEGYCGDRFHIYRETLDEHRFAVRIIRPPRDGEDKESVIVRCVIHHRER